MILTIGSQPPRDKTPLSFRETGLWHSVHGTLFVGVSGIKESWETRYHDEVLLSTILKGNGSLKKLTLLWQGGIK
jgi:hypothetical protein